MTLLTLAVVFTTENQFVRSSRVRVLLGKCQHESVPSVAAAVDDDDDDDGVTSSTA